MALTLDDRQRAMLQEMGVHVWLPASVSAPEVASVTPAPLPRKTAPVPVLAVQGQSPAIAAMDWGTLAHAAATCQACGLCAGRKNATLYPSPAIAQADWMVVGDPPDEDEDRLGRPFAEQAGVLLDNMLKAVGTRRTDSGAHGAYLTNVVKCRPPHGRNAQATELLQCAAFLDREIALVQPKVILSMGRFANQLLLGEQPDVASLPLGKLRGTVHRYHGIAVVATYHPKLLLRTGADKAKAWADLCLAVATVQETDPSLQSDP